VDPTTLKRKGTMRTRGLVVVLSIVAGGAAALAQTESKWWDVNTLGTSRPSPRHDAAMAVNYSTGGVVLFGGSDGLTTFNDTWAWTSAGWELKSPATSPYPMAWSQMVYDSWRQRNVLVGWSIDPFHPGPQTWFWDGADWIQSIGVPAWPGFSLAFDETTGEVVLFGGFQPNGNSPPTILDDTWIFDGAHWAWAGGSHPSGPESEPTPVQPPLFSSPAARGYGATAYDLGRQNIVLHGGFDGELPFTDTWLWTGRQLGWRQQSPVSSPPANGVGYRMANDLLAGRLIAVGCPDPGCGIYASPEVWSWDGVNWSLTKASNSDGPMVDDGFSVAEIPYHDGVLLFGGFRFPAYQNQTWAWGRLPQLFNTAPVPVFGLSAGEAVACTAVTATPVVLDGSQSYDSDQQLLSYLWTGPFAGGTASGPTPTVALPIGPSTITLTVSDGDLTGTASRTVRVTVAVQGLESPLGTLVPTTTQAPLPTVSFQAGRTLPLKLGLACGSQKLTSSEVAPPKLVAITRQGDVIAPTPGVVPITSTNDATGSFRSENTNWIYNLSTHGFVPGTYEARIEMPDGVVYHTLISLR
jgi:hypothetical protein